MANVTVRNVDDQVIASLKAQAKTNHRSLEGEIRHLLARHAAQQVLRSTRLDEFRERTARLYALTENTSQTDSVALIREDRDC